MPKTYEEAIELILKLQAKIEELEELVKQNSQNSSKPPSSDLHKRNKKPRSEKKQGGQPKHEGKFRKLLPIEEVTEVVKCPPREMCECGNKVKATGKYKRHQVTDIPEKIQLKVVEYQIEYGKCECCQKSYKGELPKGVSFRWFGVNIQAQLAELTTKYKLSRRDAVKYIQSAYGLKLSLGTISNYEELTSQAVQDAYGEIQLELKKSGCMNVDETGYSQKGLKRYAWIVTTPKLALFSCNRSRGKKVAKELIGEHYNGICITDRYSSYTWIDPGKRQVCWAHLKRDFTQISQRGGDSETIGTKLLDHCKSIFSIWRDPDRDLLKPKLLLIREEVEKLLIRGTNSFNIRSQRTFLKILQLKDSLWSFVDHIGVEPTNNLAERGLRSLVIHRKKSFGTQSDRGSRFIERMFSIITTCDLQKISASSFIRKTISNFNLKLQVPRLIVHVRT